MRPCPPVVAALFMCLIGWSLPRMAQAQPTKSPTTLVTAAGMYPDHLAGRKTASGVPYDPDALVITHATLPLGTVLTVQSLDGEIVIPVVVIDRGRALDGPAILVSRAVAEQLGMTEDDLVAVRVVGIDDPALDSPLGPVGPGSSHDPAPPVRSASVENRAPTTWTIQVGSFGQRDGAQELAARVDGAQITEISTGDVSTWRVTVGEYHTRDEAAGWAARLKGWGYAGFVRTTGSRQPHS